MTNTTYNYMESMVADIKNYIDDEITLTDFSDREKLEYFLYDTLFTEDSVTGNASGSYTFNAYQAEENLCHNFDLLEEACSEFGCDIGETVKKGAENCDVTIRCYLLSQAIAEVLDNMDEELEKVFDK